LHQLGFILSQEILQDVLTAFFFQEPIPLAIKLIGSLLHHLSKKTSTEVVVRFFFKVQGFAVLDILSKLLRDALA
jgi:hypothetical protein